MTVCHTWLNLQVRRSRTNGGKLRLPFPVPKSQNGRIKDRTVSLKGAKEGVYSGIFIGIEGDLGDGLNDVATRSTRPR